jgi:hypothetical protein
VNLSLQEKHEIIRASEERFAYELAKQVIEKPKASVWLIFLPILFVFYAQRIQKYKGSVRSFVAGFMRTKLVALDAAAEEVRTGIFPEQIMAGIKPKDDPAGKAQLREKQLAEIDILRQHYLLLLGGDGDSFPALLKKAYQTSGAYRSFLNRLHKAEAEVNQVAVQVIDPSPEAHEVVVRMEKLSELLREEELREIFGN